MEFNMECFVIKEASGWIEKNSITLNSFKKSNSPFYFPLLEYQVKLQNDEIAIYCHSYEVINDASRLEDASLITHEINPENEKIFYIKLE